MALGRIPGLTDLDEEIRRFEYKVQAGAEYAVTQPVFDIRLLENFLRRIEHCRIPVIAGIWPLVSVRNAEFMKNELRVSVPDSILERMARAQTPEAARAEGVAIAREMLIAVRQTVQGAQISAPQGRYSSAVDVLEALGTKSSRDCIKFPFVERSKSISTIVLQENTGHSLQLGASIGTGAKPVA